MKPIAFTAAVAVVILCMFAGACSNPRVKAQRALAAELQKREAQQRESQRHLDRGLEAWHDDDPEEARKRLERAARVNPRNANAWMALGVVAFDTDELPAAAEAFDRAARLAPTRYEPHFNMGAILEAAGDYEQAIEQYEKAQALAPDELHVMENLARCYLAIGKDPDKAKALIDSALQAERRPEWRTWLERHARAFREGK